MISMVKNLLNATSKAMNVNGSLIPVTFSYAPGMAVQVYGYTFLIEDAGTCGFGSFGAIAALTNGILLRCTLAGITTTQVVLKDNGDIVGSFSENQHFGSPGVASGLGLLTGFGNSNTVFRGEFKFPTPLELGAADSISAYVQDNLSAIGTLQVFAIVGID